MSTVNSCSITSPYNKTEECAQFTIDDLTTMFAINGVMVSGQEYTFSLWIKSDSDGSVVAKGSSLATSTDWVQYTITFTANATNLYLVFGVAGTYYVYHPQLEIGNKATDWTPSPDDTDSKVDGLQANIDQNEEATNNRFAATDELLANLENTISMLVRDENGESLMTQTAYGGWTFSMAQYNENVSALSESLNELQNETGSTKETVDTLQQAISGLQETAEYVRITVFEDEPCIELGEGDSDFKLMITNTRIMFMNGGNTPTYIDTNGLVTQNITIEGEHRHVDFVWKRRANGNYGLRWKEVTE